MAHNQTFQNGQQRLKDLEWALPKKPCCFLSLASDTRTLADLRHRSSDNISLRRCSSPHPCGLTSPAYNIYVSFFEHTHRGCTASEKSAAVLRHSLGWTLHQLRWDTQRQPRPRRLDTMERVSRRQSLRESGLSILVPRQMRLSTMMLRQLNESTGKRVIHAIGHVPPGSWLTRCH